MTTATIFHGLFQAEYGVEDDAALVAVFSTDVLAGDFADLLSDQHTELKRVANEARDNRLPFTPVPDLYWDVRPVVFDPRSTEELL